MVEEFVPETAEPTVDGADATARPLRRPPPAAERALAEAAARREAALPPRLPEVDGRGGLEPVRYGDWEVKGIATDF